MYSRRRFLQTSALVGAGLALAFSALRKLTAATDEDLLAELVDSQFENELPNPLDPGFIFRPRGQSRYEIGTYQTEAKILGEDFPMTTVWGYGNDLFPDEQGPTYPGRTFEVFFKRGATVRWTNHLPSEHLLPVDKSLHWADPEHTGRLLNPRADAQGLESVVVAHLHGGRNQSDSDGLPEYWFGPGFGVVGPRWTSGTPSIRTSSKHARSGTTTTRSGSRGSTSTPGSPASSSCATTETRAGRTTPSICRAFPMRCRSRSRTAASLPAPTFDHRSNFSGIDLDHVVPPLLAASCRPLSPQGVAERRASL